MENFFEYEETKPNKLAKVLLWILFIQMIPFLILMWIMNKLP